MHVGRNKCIGGQIDGVFRKENKWAFARAIKKVVEIGGVVVWRGSTVLKPESS